MLAFYAGLSQARADASGFVAVMSCFGARKRVQLLLVLRLLFPYSIQYVKGKHEMNRECAKAFIVTIVLVLIAAHGSVLAAGRSTEGARIVEHSGYAGCIELFNKRTRVVLCPDVGGRILEYALDGENSLFLNPKQDGWVWDGNKGIDPSGGRFDIGPEKIVPKHPVLWLGPWQGVITGPRMAQLISLEDEATGVQLVRDFKLDERTSKLLCRQTIRNISDDTQYWCHWSRTLAVGGGICIIPLTEPSRFPNKYVMYEAGSTINFAPKDPNVRIRDGYLEILGPPKNPKLGMDSYAGWFCYFTRNDLLFVKKYQTYPNRPYNEIAGLTISIWYNQNLMCELEPIGPMEEILPGESASFTEAWWLLPAEFPTGGKKADLVKLGQFIESELE
jgi:hypothetical protein